MSVKIIFVVMNKLIFHSSFQQNMVPLGCLRKHFSELCVGGDISSSQTQHSVDPPKIISLPHFEISVSAPETG